MSSHLSSNRAYFDVIQDYFLERTGKGLVLSSRDLELLMGWYRSGASAALVCQGIDDALETLNQAPRDLSACKKYVQPRVDSVDHVASRTINRSPEPTRPEPVVADEEPLVLRRLRAAQTADGRPEFRSVYAHLFAELNEGLASGQDPVPLGYAIDDKLVDEAFAALGSDDRGRIDTEIDARFGKHLSAMHPDAREETLRACRRDILHQSYGLVRIIEE